MLQKPYALPGSKSQLPIRYWNGQRSTSNTALHMAGHVIWALFSVTNCWASGVSNIGNDAVQVSFHIGEYVRICIFTDSPVVRRVESELTSDAAKHHSSGYSMVEVLASNTLKDARSVNLQALNEIIHERVQGKRTQSARQSALDMNMICSRSGTDDYH